MDERMYIKDIRGHVGKDVTIAGWVDVRRDHGKLIFLDIRDATGIVQSVVVPQQRDAYKQAEELRPEWVVGVQGEVRMRPAKMANSDIPNGDIELALNHVVILSAAKTPPFDIKGDGYDINEELRLTHRYLDLRRTRLQRNVRIRHKINQFIRDHLTADNFVEIETPILSKSTPEGARDFVVPSRLEPGKFYALPQSPQQYKQLLMVAGFERYFQIARCMRDEDTRGDRQAEFTQLDLEMSFVSRDNVMAVLETLYTKMVEALYPEKHIFQKPWPRLTYKDALAQYGTDRPDTRKDKNDPRELAFVWVTDFPLFEEKPEDAPSEVCVPGLPPGKRYAPSHHMFTSPLAGDIPKLDTDPSGIRSCQYDAVVNGNEIAGGSIRIHDPDIQRKIFDLVGFDETQKEHFSHILAAFRYGVPPHGGIASGLDRLIAVLEGEPNIREVIAFPKTGEGRDLMMGSPSRVAKEQLRELRIDITDGTEDERASGQM